MKICNSTVDEFLKNLNDRKIICFGAGEVMHRDLYHDSLLKSIAFFVDNDKNKICINNLNVNNYVFDVNAIEILNSINPDKFVILVCAQYYLIEVIKQLQKIENLKNIECYTLFHVLYNSECNLNNFFEYEINKNAFKNYKEKLNLKDKYQNNRCFIIGNGPSLEINDLNKLKNEKTFAANRIYLTFDNTDWRPTFYFINDFKLYYLDYDIIKKLDLSFKFVPLNSTIACGKVDDDIIYYHRNGLGEHNTDFSFDVSEVVYANSTVTSAMLQFAVYMGFKEIYLLGIDNNYSGNTGSSGNHFDNRYENGISKMSKIPVKCNTDRMTITYETAKKAAESVGVKIYNATRGGALEVFERVDFDSLF